VNKGEQYVQTAWTALIEQIVYRLSLV